MPTPNIVQYKTMQIIKRKGSIETETNSNSKRMKQIDIRQCRQSIKNESYANINQI